MENGKQVTDLVSRSKQFFLREIFADLGKKRELYDLNEEYAKTRKNRNVAVTLIIVGVIVAFVLVAVLVTAVISNATKNTPIDIQSFDDINLQNLLDQSRRIEDELRNATLALAQLENQRDAELAALDAETARQISLAQSTRGSQAQINGRIIQIRRQADAQRAAILQRYQAPLNEQRTQAAALQTQIEQYDTRFTDLQRNQQQALNAEREARRQEVQQRDQYWQTRLDETNTANTRALAAQREGQDTLVAQLRQNFADERAELILLYNPTYTDPAILSLINRAAVEDTPYGEIPENFAAEAPGIMSSFERVRAVSDAFASLIAQIRTIPYINAVPQLIGAIESAGKGAFQGYETIGSAFVQMVLQKDAEIAELNGSVARLNDAVVRLNGQVSTLQTQNAAIQSSLEAQRAATNIYVNAVDDFLVLSNEDGYVINASNDQNIVIRMNENLPIETGMEGVVVRSETEVVGRIRFAVDASGNVTASLIQLSSAGTPIQAFDAIALQLDGQE